MKKTFTLFILIFLSQCFKSNAQQGLIAGIVIQPSLITMRPSVFSNSGNEFDPDFNQTLRTSFGAQLDYHFSEYLGVGANLIYSPQGQKFYVPNDSGKYESHYYKFNFIKIPIFFSYNSGGAKARLIGTVGPQLMILTSAKDTYNGHDIDLTSNYAPLNLGFHFGVGMGFFLGNHIMMTIAPNFDIAFLNYNYSYDDSAPKAYVSKSPVTTCFGMQFGLKYVKNETADSETSDQ